MTVSTNNSSNPGRTEPSEVQVVRVAQAWVKPTLERLSLKQAMTTGMNSECVCCGS